MGCVLLYLLCATWVGVELTVWSASLPLTDVLGIMLCHLPVRQRCWVHCPGLWWDLPPQAESEPRGDFIIPCVTNLRHSCPRMLGVVRTFRDAEKDWTGSLKLNLKKYKVHVNYIWLGESLSCGCSEPGRAARVFLRCPPWAPCSALLSKVPRPPS